MNETVVKTKFKQTGIGLILEDWEIVRLGDEAELRNGYAFSSEYFTDRGPIVMTPGNFRLDGGLKFNDTKNIHYKGEFKNYMVLKPNDLVMVMTDLTPGCNLLGKSGIIEQGNIILHNQRIGKIIHSKRIDKSYLKCFFNSHLFSTRMKSTATGSTVRHTSKPTILNTIVPLPPLPEQKAIATALSDTDNWIESLEKLIAKKKAIKQGAIQELLTGRVRLPSATGETFEGEWEEKEFLDILSTVPTKKFQINSTEYLTSGKYPVIDQGRKYIVGYSNDDKKLFNNTESGVIIFGDHTRIFKFINFNFIIGADGTQVLKTLKDNTNFAYYFLQNCIIPNTGYNRHFKFLKEINYIFPKCQKEQAAIAEALSDMDQEIEVLENKLEKARKIKVGMMQQLLTGKIRLPYEQ